MDPLSDVLSLLKPVNYGSGGLTAGGEWSLAFPEHEGIKCYAIVEGECWLAVEGNAGSVHLQQGDCVVLPHGKPFLLGSDLALTPVDARTLISKRRYNGVVSCGSGEGFFLAGGHFLLDGDARVLLGLLPPIVSLHGHREKEAMRWHIERLAEELRVPKPGGALIAQQIAYSMLVQVLRLYLGEVQNDGIGWLFALSDKQIGSSLELMHGDPAHRWTVLELARAAGMSRTTFSETFKARVGMPPLEYLTRWRMRLAGERLLHSNQGVGEIAPALGYESESAFSAAFRRIMGSSPRSYMRAPHGSGSTASHKSDQHDRLGT